MLKLWWILLCFFYLTVGLKSEGPMPTWAMVPASAVSVWRRFQLCINYTAKPPADSHCRGHVSCNEVWNNDGSVANLGGKPRHGQPWECSLWDCWLLCSATKEKDTKTHCVAFFALFAAFYYNIIRKYYICKICREAPPRLREWNMKGRISFVTFQILTVNFL